MTAAAGALPELIGLPLLARRRIAQVHLIAAALAPNLEAVSLAAGHGRIVS